MDLYSKRILGVGITRLFGKELVIEALRKAIEGYQITADIIFHSDRGVQFTADEFRQLINDFEIT
jgi:putative transposase